MNSARTGPSQARAPIPSPLASTVPVLGEGLPEWPQTNNTSEDAQDGNQEEVPQEGVDPAVAAKSGKRSFFGFGKKKEDDKLKKKTGGALASSTPAVVAPVRVMRPESPLRSPDSTFNSSSPNRSTHPYQLPASPSRGLYPSSPRLSSPASSEIFERSVQENSIPADASPAIPSHIQTEDHIPPVLDASSLAITDDHLNPDNVEIVMHSAHQPAAVTVTGTGSSEATGTSWPDDLVAHPDNDDAASNYGALDANDVRRLSFISFADVVQSEHTEHSAGRESGHLASLPLNPAHQSLLNRSPSPIRSPVSSHGRGNSPPSGSPSLRGLDGSPGRIARPLGSPISTHSPPTGGELTIETMRQALRKTGSGDLSGARSQPLSAVSADDTAPERPF
ncbi:MAG: hypothetical protein M1827_004226 [Pycnora praestabilis]|nr:MAG: hypothetical protein M1827_004226 [Pycnora praestabilis]